MEKEKNNERKKILTIKEWHDLIRQNRDKRIYNLEKKREWKRFICTFRVFTPIPVVIGIVAAIITWNIYGPDELTRIILSWIIGITLITTVVAGFLGKIQQIFRK